MKTVPLLDCPFCGSRPETDHFRGYISYRGEHGNAVAIYCTGCDVEMSLCHEDFPGESPEHLMSILATNWNKRTP